MKLKIIYYFRPGVKIKCKMKIISLLLFSVLLYACHPSQPADQPAARVFETNLYKSEVANFIPPDTPSEDSIIMAQNYIRNWVTQKLLLHKAIENLSGEEIDIQKQVDEYRTTLLIHHYKQKLIAQRLVGDIDDKEIEAYYHKNENNFILATPIVKAVFFILPKTVSNLTQVRKWNKSDKAEDQENLEDYCLTHAHKYDNFQNRWMEVKYLLNLIPGDFNTLAKEILTLKNIEKEDDKNYYFLKINEIKREQTIAPLDYVRNEITLILKYKKKLSFENELEKQINQEGLRKNYVKIY